MHWQIGEQEMAQRAGVRLFNVGAGADSSTRVLKSRVPDEEDDGLKDEKEVKEENVQSEEEMRGV